MLPQYESATKLGRGPPHLSHLVTALSAADVHDGVGVRELGERLGDNCLPAPESAGDGARTALHGPAKRQQQNTASPSTINHEHGKTRMVPYGSEKNKKHGVAQQNKTKNSINITKERRKAVKDTSFHEQNRVIPYRQIKY